MLKNVKTEVLAASAGAGSGGAVAGFLLWLLGVLLWHVPDDAAHATAAVSAVPLPVILFLPIALAVIGALLGGHKGPQSPPPSGGADGYGSPATPAPGAIFDPSTFLSPGLSALTSAISDVIGGSVPDVPLVDHGDGTVPPPDYPSAALIPSSSSTLSAPAGTASNSAGSVPITVVTPITPGAVPSSTPAAAIPAPATLPASPTQV